MFNQLIVIVIPRDADQVLSFKRASFFCCCVPCDSDQFLWQVSALASSSSWRPSRGASQQQQRPCPRGKKTYFDHHRVCFYNERIPSGPNNCLEGPIPLPRAAASSTPLLTSGRSSRVFTTTNKASLQSPNPNLPTRVLFALRPLTFIGLVDWLQELVGLTALVTAENPNKFVRSDQQTLDLLAAVLAELVTQGTTHPI